MKYYDLHVHTTYSDGLASFERVCQEAKKRGYGLGITDHIWIGTNDSYEKIKHYIDSIYDKGVFVGAEANIGQDYTLPEETDKKIDYIVASTHFLKNDKEDYVIGPYFCYKCGQTSHFEIDYDVSRTKEYLNWILAEVKWTMENMRIDILGHPTVNPMYEYCEDRGFIRDWEDQIIDLCVSHHVAIEISNLWCEPNEDFLRRAIKRGATFSMASDGHKENEVCVLDYPIAMAEKLQLTEDDLFVPQKKRG